MPKRKAATEEDVSCNSDGSNISECKKKTPHCKKPIIRQMSESSHSGDSDEEKPLSKKSKKMKIDQSMKDAPEAESTGIKIFSTNDGDKYIDLGKKKRATVRAFKGTVLLDIREFYEAGGEEKPGKKGISLTIEQWETLKQGMNVVDDLLAKLQQKK